VLLGWLDWEGVLGSDGRNLSVLGKERLGREAGGGGWLGSTSPEVPENLPWSVLPLHLFASVSVFLSASPESPPKQTLLSCN
jgi:hypothetical protein